MPRIPLVGRVGVLLVAAALAGCQMGGSRMPVSAAGSVHQRLFNEGWKFKLLTTGDEAAAASADESGAVEDGDWRTVNLPHDWSIEQPFEQKWASGTGFLPGGIGWYRKHFVLTPEQRGKNVTVRFDGVYKNSTVYVNGHKLGERPYGYSSFEYDLTPYLKQEGENVLAVRVDHHDFADSRWYPGSGIYRNVYLTATGPTHFDTNGVFVSTPEITKETAKISLEFSFENSSVQPLYASTRILDPQGKEITSVKTEVPAEKPQRHSRHTQAITIPNPVIWSTDRPSMYTAVTSLVQDGKTLDTYNTPFGIREAKFDPNTGFWLNGVNMKLKGVCLHEDAGALGAAIPQQVWERRLLILRSAGANAIRCSHNPPAPEFLDLCDRMGFLVMDEAFDEWNCPTYTKPQGKKKWMDTWSGTKFDLAGYHSDFDKWADTDIKDMVMRDRNHPSIIMWSIGNEIDYPDDPYPANNEDLVAVAKRLIADVKSVDTTRPVTAACASIGTNKWYQDLDIIGYNYQEKRYAEDHKAMPNRVIFGSENDIKRLSDWLAVKDNPFISAQFLWTGIDYLGEAGRPAPGTTTAWPERSRPDGFLDLAGFKKPMYYYRKSLWNDEPMVKIAENLPEEDAARKLVVPAGLSCYTNCDSVEFMQAGKTLGTFALPADTHVIKVPANAANGPIHAFASKGGKLVQDTYDVAGPAARLDLWEFPSLLGPGDGPNVAQIEVMLVDRYSTRCRDAGNVVSVKIEGPGKLLGIESGDKDSHESYQAPQHKLFGGRMLIYVETHGKVTVTASTQGVPAAVIRVGG